MATRKPYTVKCGAKVLHHMSNKNAAVAIARDETGIYKKRCCVLKGKRAIRCFPYKKSR